MHGLAKQAAGFRDFIFSFFVESSDGKESKLLPFQMRQAEAVFVGSRGRARRRPDQARHLKDSCRIRYEEGMRAGCPTALGKAAVRGISSIKDYENEHAAA